MFSSNLFHKNIFILFRNFQPKSKKKVCDTNRNSNIFHYLEIKSIDEKIFETTTKFILYCNNKIQWHKIVQYWIKWGNFQKNMQTSAHLIFIGKPNDLTQIHAWLKFSESNIDFVIHVLRVKLASKVSAMSINQCIIHDIWAIPFVTRGSWCAARRI